MKRAAYLGHDAAPLFEFLGITIVAPTGVQTPNNHYWLDAARNLARSAVDVTVIDHHNYHLFQPLLYQVATAVLSPGDITEPIPGRPAASTKRHSAPRRGDRYHGAPSQDTLRRSAELRLPSARDPALDRPGFRWLEQWTSSPTPCCPATSADRRGRLSVSNSVVEGRSAVLSR